MSARAHLPTRRAAEVATFTHDGRDQSPIGAALALFSEQIDRENRPVAHMRAERFQ